MRQLLRLPVAEQAQQARPRNLPRVRAEHARNVSPDLEPIGTEHGGEVRRRGIRTATAEHDRLTVAVARDETLGQMNISGLRQPRLERRIRLVLTARREIPAGLARIVRIISEQQLARVNPVRPGPRLREQPPPDTAREPLATGQYGSPRCRARGRWP